MKFFKLFALTVLAFTLIFATSCEKKKTTPKLFKEKFTKENVFSLVEQIRKDSTIELTDLDLLASGIARYSNVMDSLYGKTPQDVIKTEERIRRNQFGLNLVTNAISGFSRFRYDGWKPAEINGTKYNVFTYTVFNVSKENIRRISGYLQFLTSNNQLIRAYRINVDQTIEGGKFTQFQSTFIHDTTNQNENFLVNALKQNPASVFVAWRPTYIELSGGQKIDLEQQ